ncbi:uncharacterized protein [Anabrus simplex]|uniref:uncharacterized protein n=1 Tax=Anabrus simplex TaxID=316456 RepID=UPI0035A379FA
MVGRTTVGLVVPLVLGLVTGVLYILQEGYKNTSETSGVLLPPIGHTSYDGLQLVINEYLKLCPIKKQKKSTRNKGINSNGTNKIFLNQSSHHGTTTQFDGNDTNNINQQSTNQYHEVLKKSSTKEEHNDGSPVSTPFKGVSKTKSNVTSVICHILLGALLLVSAAIALFEAFRDRVTNKIRPQTTRSTASTTSAPETRRCSLADLTVSRHARRESVQLHQQQHQQTRRLQTAVSFDSSTGPPPTVPRSSYRLLGARPPPLQRRSSFPVPLPTTQVSGLPVTMEQSRPPSGSATPSGRLSRRPSVEHSEEDSSPDTRRRVRIIRRH